MNGAEQKSRFTGLEDAVACPVSQPGTGRSKGRMLKFFIKKFELQPSRGQTPQPREKGRKELCMMVMALEAVRAKAFRPCISQKILKAGEDKTTITTASPNYQT